MSSQFSKSVTGLIVVFIAAGLISIPFIGIIPLVAAVIVIYGIVIFANQVERKRISPKDKGKK